MNNGTIGRTVAVAIAIINQILITFNIDIFKGSTDNIAYQIISVIVLFVTVALALYMNNDFSPEACKGTGYTRLLKLSKKDVIGENFFDQPDEVEEVEGDA